MLVDPNLLTAWREAQETVTAQHLSEAHPQEKEHSKKRKKKSKKKRETSSSSSESDTSSSEEKCKKRRKRKRYRDEVPNWMPPPWWQYAQQPQWPPQQQPQWPPQQQQFVLDTVPLQPTTQTVNAITPDTQSTVVEKTLSVTAEERRANNENTKKDLHLSSESEKESNETMSYYDKIRHVREMMGYDEEEMDESCPTAMSVEQTQNQKSKPKLPYSPSIMEWFREYEEELKGESDKRRNMQPLETGFFPKGLKTSMKPYMMDCPWDKGPRANPDLLESNIFPHKFPPKVAMKYQKVEDLENHNRDMLSIGSYTDTFLWATKENLKQILNKLDCTRYQKTPSMNMEQIQDLHENMEMSLELLQSSARGLQDLIKGTVYNVGLLLLSRRDAYTDGMISLVSQATKNKLRQESLNTRYLFEGNTLEVAKRSATEEKKDKVHEQMLYGEKKSQRGGHTPRGGRGGRGRGRENLWKRENDAPKFSFRGRGKAKRGNPNTKN